MGTLAATKTTVIDASLVLSVFLATLTHTSSVETRRPPSSESDDCGLAVEILKSLRRSVKTIRKNEFSAVVDCLQVIVNLLKSMGKKELLTGLF